MKTVLEYPKEKFFYYRGDEKLILFTILICWPATALTLMLHSSLALKISILTIVLTFTIAIIVRSFQSYDKYDIPRRKEAEKHKTQVLAKVRKIPHRNYLCIEANGKIKDELISFIDRFHFGHEFDSLKDGDEVLVKYDPSNLNTFSILKS